MAERKGEVSRKTNESIVIDGRITVKIVRVDGEVVKVGIQAPAEVPVHRQEVYDEIQRSNMSKLGEDGKPIYREDGKVMKGPNYFKPSFEEILR